MRILINDHAGHPFQVQLSRSLAARGHEVLHTFTAELQTPRGALRRREGDPTTFSITPIALSKEFSRYGLVRRYLQEKELGRVLKTKVNEFKPDVVISANTPLGAQAMLASACRENGAGFVFWLQDLLGVGIRNNLRKKLPFLGSLIGRYYMHLEYKLLKESNSVVVITEDFVPICQDAGVAEKDIQVVQNWAPLKDVPVLDKKNDWSCEQGVDQTFNFIYSGTLGMKHNPELLIKLALHFQDRDDVKIVVLTEGLGADYLKMETKKNGIGNLILMPFQPFEVLPMVLASADVLIANLEPDAGIFAVPSKVLTYLCAKRPLLLSVPPENLASRIVKDNGAGIVVPPSDENAFVQAAERLFSDKGLRENLAKNARAYAEKTFDIEKITDKFEKIII